MALGDLQCSVRSTLICPDTDAVLNVSTSAQMAFVKKAGFVPPKQVLQSTKSSQCIFMTNFVISSISEFRPGILNELFYPQSGSL